VTIVPPEGGSPFDALRGPDGRWPARQLQILMGYSRWENLAPALKRAMASARNEGLDVEENFLRSQEVAGQRGPGREDFRLTRHAAYLLAMNGDPNKAEVAAAQTYFAVKTREAEVRGQSPALPQDYEEALVHLLDKVRENKQLESRVRELEPSAQAWDVLASAAGDYSLRDSAFILNRDPAIDTGQQRLMKLIRALGMVDRNDVPYARHASHLTERAQSYTHPRTQEEVLAKPQIRITVQGLRYLHGKLGGEGPLQLPMRDAS